jgi:hypothetical protein
MLTDPISLAAIGLPVVIFYLIITSMPRNYPNIEMMYFYALILTAFSVYARYDLAIRLTRIEVRAKEVDELLKCVKDLMKKADPVKTKRNREYGEFQ